ncbi:hypothetical protein GCM10023258_28510 [Terrabacter aeriphilus]|uniref:CHAP domain-containing protein n=1 Tax=Terrabacter aeriphilus TaxID=515662 RepID=A0ABP9JGG0_9MICO
MTLTTLTRRRLAAAGIATASALAFLPAGQADAAPAIVVHARSHIGEQGGSCKEFVQRMYNETHANDLQPGYWTAYVNAGYHLVAKSAVVPGDIIQETDTSSHTTGIHTAIVTGDPAGATIRVVDSNWVGHNTVGEHAYDPDAHAASKGGKAYYWHK